MRVSRYVPPKFEPWPLAKDPPYELTPKPDNPPTGFELFAFVVCAGATAFGFALALIELAPVDATRSFQTAGIWGQQDGLSAFACVCLLLTFIYTAKRAVLRRVAPAREVVWYALILLTSLPYLWFLVPDWHHPYVPKLWCWIGFPILFWTIPTASFIVDRLNPEPLPTGLYLMRSGFEVVFLFPFWCLLCQIYFETLRGMVFPY
jgi:hypothetical protein